MLSAVPFLVFESVLRDPWELQTSLRRLVLEGKTCEEAAVCSAPAPPQQVPEGVVSRHT